MERFIARQNIEHYRRLIEAERDPRQIALLQRMLAEEEARLNEAESRASERHPVPTPHHPGGGRSAAAGPER
jgi:hypothetical protein